MISIFDVDSTIEGDGKPLTIGRVRTSSAFALVCMQDVSSVLGYILNGERYHPGKRVKLDSKRVGFGVIVLRDGDTVQIPGTLEGKFLNWLSPLFAEHLLMGNPCSASVPP